MLGCVPVAQVLKKLSFFAFLRAPHLTDQRLGELRFRRRRWTAKNASCFGATGVELRIPGTREGIAPEARALLDSLEEQYARIQAEALPHFRNHLEPYAEELKEPVPENLWPRIKLVRVWFNAYGKAGAVELGYETTWDIEHLIGVTILDGHVTDFCASIGPWW